jgi:predicted TIM-barrel fold metal-dependent hydrolase
MAIDVHCHLGISVLLSPDIDLQASSPRVRHLLDCDAPENTCRLDLDVYANGNFTEEGMRALRTSTIAQGLWGSAFARTHTIPNLVAEMDAMRVERSHILPIKMGLPFGDDLTGKWRDAIDASGQGERLLAGLSVHPRDEQRLEAMRLHAAGGARLMKLHPTVQSFYPDDPNMMDLYEEAQRLGLIIFFHGGRAGIEPESRQRYAMPRHYEAVLSEFPRLQVILGHAGARDGAAMLELSLRYDNAWLGIHGQGVSALDEVIRQTGGERLLFGTDWPFYHIGMSLAKVLLCTESVGSRAARGKILRDNALLLFG